ncbi:3-oxoacyl-[acyl-carrier-protein] synthase, partial [Ceratobasidium sp. 423]
MSLPNGKPFTGADGDISTRPLVIQAGAARISFPVPATGSAWIAAEVLREEFKHEYTPRDVPQPESSEEETLVNPAAALEAQVELAAAFLGSVASKIGADSQSIQARIQVLQATTAYFTSTFLSKRDIHSIAATFDADVRKSVLTSYFLAISALEAHVPGQVPRQPQSALLDAAASGEAEIYGLFGGQGTNEVYFDELKSLYEIYKPYVYGYIATMTQDVLIPLANSAYEKNLTFFTHGLDVLGWLDGSVPVPPLEYLASVPVSFPVIGLTQLVQYLVVSSVTGLTPGELRDRLKGATGHSQGILSAVVAATSTDLESFSQNSAKALRWWVWAGARGQEAFPVLAVEPNIVKDSVDGGEGVPSPMLSVTGLPLAALEKHITGVNKHLPKNSQLNVALHN